MTVEKLQVIADVLAKSVVLAYYEASLAAVGDTLLTRHKMVGRVEVGEKPEVLWDLPALNRLFLRLADDYELAERRLAVERKLELISRTVGTLADLMQNTRALRVEWYIVLLIVIEIGLTLYQLFVIEPR